jgi:hypothetical protein
MLWNVFYGQMAYGLISSESSASGDLDIAFITGVMAQGGARSSRQ